MSNCFVYSFIVSLILFIVFIPGMFFTIPASYKDRPDTLSKIIVGSAHGSIFLIIYTFFACLSNNCK
jgi:hypothetical protein